MMRAVAHILCKSSRHDFNEVPAESPDLYKSDLHFFNRKLKLNFYNFMEAYIRNADF